MRIALTSAVLLSTLAVAAPASAEVLFVSNALSTEAVAYPSSLGFSTPSATARAARLFFRLRGTATVDGDNSYQDNFTILLNGTPLFSGTFNLGGGGNNVTFTNPSGAVLSNYIYNGFNQGGSIKFKVPVGLAAGSNTFSFAYTSPGPSNGGGQPLSDEGFNIERVALISGAVPEPATWAMMILGFGLVGGAMRSRGRRVSVSFA